MRSTGLATQGINPAVKDTTPRNMVLCIREMPPGSHPRKLSRPVQPVGVIHQHLDAEPGGPACFLAAGTNAHAAVGANAGAGFDVLENAPECEASEEAGTNPQGANMEEGRPY